MRPETMAEPSSTDGLPAGSLLAPLAAWAVPGAGHLLLGRRGRALLFFLIVATAVTLGVALEGNLFRVVPDRPLSILGTLACMGAGLPYFVLRFVADYSGEVTAVGYEYGTAFLITGGLMNLLLVLDALDIARGRKP